MNRRRSLVALLALAVVPLAAEAQQPASKAYRIGYLGTGSSATPTHPVEILRDALRKLGYAEGQNLEIELRLGNRPDELQKLAEELVRLNVDLLVAESTPHVRAARAATKRIPIVMMAAGDPVGEGFVASLARPGGNVTGFTFLAVELSRKRLELLRDAVPGVSTVAALWNPASPVSANALKETQAAAKLLELRIEAFGARSPDDVEAALSAMRKKPPGALIVLPDPMLHTQRDRIVHAATSAGVPTVYHFADFADAGALLTYGPNLPDLYRRAAGYVDRILKGTNPADLPVEQPAKFELVLNLKAAQALALKIPQSILLRADRVIE